MAQHANSVHEGSGAAALPGEDEVRAQLDRIRCSPDFEVPDRAREFLSYIVEETLTGRASRIKAYSIATEVFGRDASFDAQNDPVVRIEAGRIRRALERYYLTAGRDDPLGITMPKGGYVPVFSQRERQVPPPDDQGASTKQAERAPSLFRIPRNAQFAVAAGVLLIVLAAVYRYLPSPVQQESAAAIDVQMDMPNIPRLIVEPFEDLTGSESSAIIARGLTEEVIAQIANFKEIVVIADRQRGASDIAMSSEGKLARYALEGGVRIERDRLRLTSRLIRRADRSVVWSGVYDEDLRVHDLLDLEADVAGAVATALAQPYGVIFHADASQVPQSPPDDWEAYQCTLAYYGYRANLNPQTHASVQGCLTRAVERFPTYATGWALLSLTYLDEVRFRYRLNPTTRPPLELAAEAARHAVELDPQNVRGLEAQMLAFFFRGDVETALSIGARAFAINRNDVEFVGEYGTRLALAGQWSQGCTLISQSLVRNPGPVGYFETSLALCTYMQGDYTAAEQWIRAADLGANPIYHFVAAAIVGQLGEKEEAARERQWIESNAPELLKNVRGEVAIRIRRQEDQVHFIDGLVKAGVAVPGA